MRTILVSIMLIIVMIILYENTIGSTEGSLSLTKRRGIQVNIEIEGIDP